MDTKTRKEPKVAAEESYIKAREWEKLNTWKEKWADWERKYEYLEAINFVLTTLHGKLSKNYNTKNKKINGKWIQLRQHFLVP